MLSRAERDVLLDRRRRKILDGFAGMWCVNAGHSRPEIAAAVHKQLTTDGIRAPFQMGHPIAFELPNVLTQLTPGDLDHVFFRQSGSERWIRAQDCNCLSPRARRCVATTPDRQEKGYHGVGFGGISVGGW